MNRTKDTAGHLLLKSHLNTFKEKTQNEMAFFNTKNDIHFSPTS